MKTRDLIVRYTLRGRRGNASTVKIADVRRLANDEIAVSIESARGTPESLSNLQIKGGARFPAFFSGCWEQDLREIERVFEAGLYPVESREVAPVVTAAIHAERIAGKRS